MATQATEPLFVEPGGGPAFAHRGGSSVLKVSSDQTSGAYAVFEIITDPGAGSTLHAHSREDEFFYVLEGEYEFQHAAKQGVAPAGSTIYVRRNTPHRYRNRLDTPSRMLSVVVPGGLEGFLRERGELPPDQLDDPRRLSPLARKYQVRAVDAPASPNGANPGLWRQPGEGPTWNVIGERITPKIRSRESGDLFCLFEEVTPGYSGPPLHSHDSQDEIFCVLEGEYTFRCGDARFDARPGSVVVIPHGLAHGFANVLSRPGRLLIATIPGGLDLFFEAVDQLGQGDRPDPLQVMELGAQYGLRFVSTTRVP